MTGPLLQVPGDAVGSAGARATDAAAAVDGAIAVPVSQVSWTSVQHITADAPERH
ncbi:MULTISPECIES: hypothetical protein [Nonomuraea]|uniref:Uncharacterized protein n=1 Tax=Nonomuraea ferruginea TaxID=46174 RepID=A0ABT4TBS2_9ACTN|nr:hypothetical protein [Nonomuraea ferruginea]MDA0646800.1 hypothetical protein [Nonomuraea ferruginea]